MCDAKPPGGHTCFLGGLVGMVGNTAAAAPLPVKTSSELTKFLHEHCNECPILSESSFLTKGAVTDYPSAPTLTRTWSNRTTGM